MQASSRQVGLVQITHNKLGERAVLWYELKEDGEGRRRVHRSAGRPRKEGTGVSVSV